MTKNIRSIIVIIAIIFLFSGIVVFIKNLETKKAINNFNQLISKYDNTAKLDYKKIKTIGVFKPTGLICHQCKIKGKKLNLLVEQLDIDIKDPDNMVFLLNNASYTKGEESTSQSRLNYKISTEETIKITATNSDDTTQYVATLPQNFLFNNPYDGYIIKYNKKDTPIFVNLKNNLLQSIKYEDEGLQIYHQNEQSPNQDNYISKTNANIINISSEVVDSNHSFNIYIKSDDNFIVNKSENSNILQNNNFGILIDAKYNNNKQAISQQKTIEISNFDIKFPDVKFHLNGNLIQDTRDIAPYGKLNFSIEQYERFISDFFNSISTTTLPDNAPNILLSAKEDPENNKEKTLIFLAKLNDSTTEMLELIIEREPTGLPTINEIPFNEVVEIYKEIFKTPSALDENSPENSTKNSETITQEPKTQESQTN